jgi:hypothetical protein
MHSADFFPTIYNKNLGKSIIEKMGTVEQIESKPPKFL